MGRCHQLKCMGEKISIMERNILIAAMLSKYEIRVYKDKEVEDDNSLVLRPRNMMLTISKVGNRDE